MKENAAHEKYRFELRDQTVRAPAGTTAKIYQALQDQLFKRSCDWVCVLGGECPFMWVLWGCTFCMCWTIAANSWYRAQRRARTLKPESASAGADEGHWRCPGCFEPWSWTLCGDMRMVVIGDGNPTSGFTPGSYTFSYIGPVSEAVNNKMNFLKAAALLKELDGKSLTTSHILGALQVLHDKTNATFSRGMPEVSTKMSTVIPREKLDKHNIDIVCEHPTLSLRGQNLPYQVIDKRNIKQEVNVIDEVYLDYLLDVAASAYDVDGMWSSLGDGGRRMYWKIHESEGFKAGRAAIRNRL
jgi:hypothetical protein